MWFFCRNLPSACAGGFHRMAYPWNHAINSGNGRFSLIKSSKTLLSSVCPASWISRQCKYGRFLQENPRKLYAPVQPWRAAGLGLAPVRCDIIISDEVIIYIGIFRCMFSRQKKRTAYPTVLWKYAVRRSQILMVEIISALYHLSGGKKLAIANISGAMGLVCLCARLMCRSRYSPSDFCTGRFQWLSP